MPCLMLFAVLLVLLMADGVDSEFGVLVFLIFSVLCVCFFSFEMAVSGK